MAAVFAAGGLATAGPSAARSAQVAPFTSGVSLVNVYASVSDQAGRALQGLAAADFTIEEDGEPQAVAAFTTGLAPLSVAVALDRSFSIPPPRLALAAAATRRFVSGLAPDDRVMVLLVGSGVEAVSPLGADRAEAVAALGHVDSWGTTPLYDAIWAAVDAVEGASGRRALVLLTDGDDRGSQVTIADTLAHVRQQDVLVYPIALGTRRPAVFAELAAATGGRSFAGADTSGLDAAFAAITADLRAQYLLGYVPTRPLSAGGWRGIRVRVNRPGARVRARDGYLAR